MVHSHKTVFQLRAQPRGQIPSLHAKCTGQSAILHLARLLDMYMYMDMYVCMDTYRCQLYVARQYSRTSLKWTPLKDTL